MRFGTVVWVLLFFVIGCNCKTDNNEWTPGYRIWITLVTEHPSELIIVSLSVCVKFSFVAVPGNP